jgi:preprotein translocase subunit SecF
MRFFELIPSGTRIDFLGKRRLAFAISLGLVLISLAAVPLRGVRLGIDFAGGTEVLVRFDAGVEADEGRLRPIVGACGAVEPSVVRYGEGASEYLIRFRDVASPEAVQAAVDDGRCPLREQDRATLDAAAKAEGGEDAIGGVVDRIAFGLENAVGPMSVERVEFVGPKVGDDLRRDGIASIGIACLLILVYVGFRFSPRYAPGAVAALIHDVVITAGFFVICGLEFDLTVLAALLAILGYSLNDTIVIFDRIRENMTLHTKVDLEEVLNRSVNDVLSRTLLTSGITITAVAVLLVLGGEVIRPFAIAMTFGMVVGTYSSVYIAAAILLWLERRRQAAPAGAAAGGAGKAKRARA